MCTCNGNLVADPGQKTCIKGPEFSGKNNGCPTCGKQVYRGNPVNSGTGLKSQTEIDYRSPSGLEFKRFYNSQLAYESPTELLFTPDYGWTKPQYSVMGYGWHFGWDRTIRATESTPPVFPMTSSNSVTSVYRAGTVSPLNLPSYFSTGPGITTAYVERGDGKVYTFTKDINGNWVTDPDIKDQLIGTIDTNGVITGWTYTTDDQEVEQYDAAGRLLSITDKTGLTTSLGYSQYCSANLLDTATGEQTAVCTPIGMLTTITDPYGRSLTLDYDTNYNLARMTDPAGHQYRYTYSGGNLNSVIYPDDNIPGGVTRTYQYDEIANVSSTPDLGVSYAHTLTGITDENGHRYATYAYDSQGRAISSEHGNTTSATGADRISFSYNADGTTTFTDALNTTYTDAFQKVQGVVLGGGTSQPAVSGTPAASSITTYDVNGNVASHTDLNGNKTCYFYDLSRNLETMRIEGLPSTTDCSTAQASPPAPTADYPVRIITTQWHANWRFPVAVAEPKRITQYVYNGDVVGGNTVNCGYKSNGTDPVPGVMCSKTIQATTDASGVMGLGATVTGSPRATSYTYNANGQVLTMDGPRTGSDITTYDYDTQGNLDWVTNALNQTTYLGDYDANGRVGTITDPNGLVTGLTYDTRGRLKTRSSGGEITSYTYDGVGDLKTVSLPGGAYYSYTYDDAHRLTDITDRDGNSIHYTLDNAGNRTSEQVKNSSATVVQTHSRVFDALNRLYQDIGAVNQTTTYKYDANGNLIKTTDANSHDTLNHYDALNRLNQTTNPDSGVIQYAYDGLDQLAGVTDPLNHATQYTRDGLGNLTQVASPDAGSTASTYDKAGNLKTRTDAKGQISTYNYDELNRVTSIAYTDPQDTSRNKSVTYHYDQGVNGIGHLTQVTDSTGTTNYSYDQHGRLTSETQTIAGTNYTTGYTYDAQGRLSDITYPSGRTVDYAFDTMGRISQIITTFNGSNRIIVSAVDYEPFGGIHKITYGNGQSYKRRHDQDGRIDRYTLMNGNQIDIGYDDVSQITSITDQSNPSYPALYSYDGMGRLKTYNQSTNKSYTYDTVGNRTTQTIGGIDTVYGYDPNSNRLASITVGNGTAQPVNQDLVGSTTSDSVNGYTYDVRGRLIGATTAAGNINYEIDAQGLRVRKQWTYAGTDTLYHYDAQGHLIAENENGSNRYTREYIYLGDQPVAVLK